MNSLYYTKIEILGHEYEAEVEYEYEPEEPATPTSPPYPAQVLIYRVSLMRNTVGSLWSSVDIETILDKLQLAVIKEEIVDHIRRLDFPRRAKRRSAIIVDEREAA